MLARTLAELIQFTDLAETNSNLDNSARDGIKWHGRRWREQDHSDELPDGPTLPQLSNSTPFFTLALVCI